MAEVKITITAEDGTKQTFRAIESGGKSAFDGIKNSAVESAAKSQSAFDALGIKSAAAMNAQKDAINSAYAQIKASATSTNDEITRAEKARASAIEQIDKQNFAVRKSLLSSLKEHWLAVTGAIVAAWAVVNKAIDYAKLGAQALQAEESFRQVTASYGENADALLQKMKEVSKGYIDDSDLQQKAVKSLQQHLSGQDIVNLLEISRSAARSASTDIASAFEGITTAVENQAVRGLKHYGIVIDQAKAFETYAEKIGVARDALSEEQQTQALVNAVLEEGRRQMKAYGDMTENAFEKMQRAEAQMKEFKETIGKGLLVGLQALAGVFYAVAAGAMEVAAAIMAIVGATIYLQGLNPAVAFTSIGKGLRDTGRDVLNAAKDMHNAASVTAGKGWDLWAGLAPAAQQAKDAVAGAAKDAKDRAAAEEKVKTTIEASLPVYAALSQAVSGASASRSAFAGDQFSEALAVEHEHLDANRAALGDYQGALAGVLTLMQSGGMDALPALIRANDEHAKVLAGITVNLDGVKAGYGRYLATLDEAAAKQIQYQQKIKTALEAEMSAAYKASPALGDQVKQAVQKQEEEIRKAEQASAQARLQAYTKFYDELKRLHADTLKDMADKVREQAELEKTILATRKSASDLTFDLQKRLMTPEETYYATMERNEQMLAQAMMLSGKSKIDALEEYKRAAASTATEIKEGDKVVISLSDSVADAMGNIATAQQAIESEGAQMAQENANALATIQNRVLELEQEMNKAQSAVEGLRQQIVSLDAQISAQRVLEIDVSHAVSSLATVQSQLASILSSASQVGSAAPSAVSSGISSAVTKDGTIAFSSAPGTGGSKTPQDRSVLQGWPGLASGTRYVPETGIYQLHQGERVLNPRESMQYDKRENTAAPVSITIPSITVIARDGDDPRALARKLARPIRDELRRLQYMQ